MNKILITGGFGYIGSKFLEKFSNDYEIVVIDNLLYGLKNQINNLTHLKKDVRSIDKEDLKDIDYVLHLSELSNDPLGEINENLTYSINHYATKKLLDLCNDTKVSKFIYMSSCAVYGKNEKLVNEASETNPLTTYSKSKILNENYILNNEFNFETTILRNATVFGYSKNLRIDLVINELVYEAVFNRKIVLKSDGTPLRPFVHVEDLVNIINMLFVTSDKLDKEIINIGNINYSIKDIAKSIGAILGIKNIKFGDKDPDQRSYNVDFTKLNSLYPNYEFSYDLNSGIVDLIENYEKHDFDSNVYRLKKIHELIKKDKVDSELYFN